MGVSYQQVHDDDGHEDHEHYKHDVGNLGVKVQLVPVENVRVLKLSDHHHRGLNQGLPHSGEGILQIECESDMKQRY